MKLKIHKSYVIIDLLLLVYILGQNIFYLVPINSKYNLIAYIILMLMTGYFIVVKSSWKIERDSFTFLMLSPFILSLIAATVEIVLYQDANFITSVWHQTQWWIYGFSYFIFQYALNKNKSTYNKLIKSFIVASIIQILIGIIQYIHSDTIFTYAPMTKRLGSIRFYFPIVLMVFAYFWSLNLFLNKKKRVVSIIVMIAVLFEAMFVQQFRSTLMGILISTVVGFMLWKNVSYKKIGVFIIGVIISYIIYLNVPFLQQSIKYLLNGDTSLDVRHYLIDFILENAKNRWLFGSGWVSSPMAYEYASTPYKVHINWGVFAFADGGIFSIFYSYGIFGVIWVIVLWSCILKKAWILYTKKNNYFYLLFPLYQIATMYIDIHWYIHDQFFVMAMFCALINYEIKKYDIEERTKEYGKKAEIT